MLLSETTAHSMAPLPCPMAGQDTVPNLMHLTGPALPIGPHGISSGMINSAGEFITTVGRCADMLGYSGGARDAGCMCSLQICCVAVTLPVCVLPRLVCAVLARHSVAAAAGGRRPTTLTTSL